MPQNYHVGKNGPAPCRAEFRACRYKDNPHFDNMTAAEAEFRRQILAKTGDKQTVSKDRAPQKVPLKDIDANLGVDTYDDAKSVALDKLGSIMKSLGLKHIRNPKIKTLYGKEFLIAKLQLDNLDCWGKITPMVSKNPKTGEWFINGVEIGTTTKEDAIATDSSRQIFFTETSGAKLAAEIESNTRRALSKLPQPKKFEFKE